MIMLHVIWAIHILALSLQVMIFFYIFIGCNYLFIFIFLKLAAIIDIPSTIYLGNQLNCMHGNEIFNRSNNSASWIPCKRNETCMYIQIRKEVRIFGFMPKPLILSQRTGFFFLTRILHIYWWGVNRDLLQLMQDNFDRIETSSESCNI